MQRWQVKHAQFNDLMEKFKGQRQAEVNTWNQSKHSKQIQETQAKHKNQERSEKHNI